MALIYLNPLRQQLENARQQIAILTSQRQQHHEAIADIDQQIQQWNAYIQATAALLQQEANPAEDQGLADLCRMALEAYGGNWVTAQQVRGYIAQLGYTLQYNNPMAVLHNTLKRVGRTGNDFGNTVYAKR
jgi:hypothetical protein